MSETLVTHIDALVHPNWQLMNFPGRPQELWTKWDQRVDLLVSQPESVMFYFSIFPNQREKWDQSGRLEFLRELDSQRKAQYLAKLGNRFFAFNFEELVAPSILEERGMTYHPATTTLLAYGVYYEVCVDRIKGDIEQALGIMPKNSSSLEDLSYCSHFDFGLTHEEARESGFVEKYKDVGSQASFRELWRLLL